MTAPSSRWSRAPGSARGACSSPAGATTLPYWPKTNSKKVLRRMLRDLDRQLARRDRAVWWAVNCAPQRESYATLDARRRAVREKLKALGRKA